MFAITYNRSTYNANRSYYQNSNRYVATTIVSSKEELAFAIETIKAKGGYNVRVYDNCGKRVSC